MSATDRELLERAAKASGLEFSDGRQLAPKNYLVRPVGGTHDQWIGWNPLTDDGDALRLAVKLGIQIDPRDPETRAFGPVGERVDEYHKPDAFAATRRAIVRAAAALAP